MVNRHAAKLSDQWFRVIPALCLRCDMNSAGSGSSSQTCGRKTARLFPSRMINPSVPGRSCAMKSGSLLNDMAWGCRAMISTGSGRWLLLPARGGSDGRRRRRPRRFSTTSATRGRCASIMPIQPRSRPSFFNVTKVARLPAAPVRNCRHRRPGLFLWRGHAGSRHRATRCNSLRCWSSSVRSSVSAALSKRQVP